MKKFGAGTLERSFEDVRGTECAHPLCHLMPSSVQFLFRTKSGIFPAIGKKGAKCL